MSRKIKVRANSSCPAIVALSFEKFARRLINDQIAGSGTVRALIVAA